VYVVIAFRFSACFTPDNAHAPSGESAQEYRGRSEPERHTYLQRHDRIPDKPRAYTSLILIPQCHYQLLRFPAASPSPP
jgi:hypothetical protein